MSKGQTETQTTSIPQWQQDAWTDLLGKANSTTNAGIASIDYPSTLNQINNSSQGILGQQVDPAALASGITSAGNESWTDPGVASSYMNPYLNTALKSQIGVDTSTLLNPQLAGIDASTAASGALGGDRSQVLKGQVINNFNQNESNQVAQAQNAAYATGQNAFQSDAARKLAGAEGAASTTLQGTGNNIYANSAATQNTLAGISASEAPLQQVATQAGILSGLPNQNTTSKTSSPNGGAFGGILGGILGGAGQLLTGMKAAKGGIMDLEPFKKKKTRRAPKKKKAAK